MREGRTVRTVTETIGAQAASDLMGSQSMTVAVSGAKARRAPAAGHPDWDEIGEGPMGDLNLPGVHTGDGKAGGRGAQYRERRP
jgi:hypothetical protein